MIVISDTTPIISLMKIKHLKLLRDLYGEIHIPEAVFHELAVSKNYQSEAQIIQDTDYIKVLSVNDREAVATLCLTAGLDAGESEAIVLSDETHADLLLMDEAKGRQVARQMGLTITGTIGILMTAFDEKLLSAEEIIECMDGLKANGRHISDQLYSQLMEKITRK